MIKTPRTNAAWKTCIELEARTPLRDLCADMEVELEDAKYEIESLKETIRDQENHIRELQSMRRYTPGYTAEP